MGSPDAKKVFSPGGKNGESIEIPEVKWPIKSRRKQKIKVPSMLCILLVLFGLLSYFELHDFDVCPGRYILNIVIIISMYGCLCILFASFHPVKFTYPELWFYIGFQGVTWGSTSSQLAYKHVWIGCSVSTAFSTKRCVWAKEGSLGKTSAICENIGHTYNATLGRKWWLS